MSLLLMHTPGEWDGTFFVTATALINDLLSDGEPIGVTFTTEDDLGVRGHGRVLVHSLVNSTIKGVVPSSTVEVEIDLNHVIALEIA